MTNVAVIRLALLEKKLALPNSVTQADIAGLETSVISALGEAPTISFLWLIEFWIKSLRADGSDNGVKFLQMSYALGPNEGWIAARRNRLSFRLLTPLQGEFAEQVMSEFVGLVRSRFFGEAANVLADSGQALREKMLSRLVDVPELERRDFARVLESMNLEGVVVPGVAGKRR